MVERRGVRGTRGLARTGRGSSRTSAPHTPFLTPQVRQEEEEGEEEDHRPVDRGDVQLLHLLQEGGVAADVPALFEVQLLEVHPALDRRAEAPVPALQAASGGGSARELPLPQRDPERIRTQPNRDACR